MHKLVVMFNRWLVLLLFVHFSLSGPLAHASEPRANEVKAKDGVILNAAFPPKNPQWRGEAIALVLEEGKLRDVLQMLSLLGEFELLLADDVTGTVTLDDQNVPWDKALAELLTKAELRIEVVEGKVRISRKPAV